MAALVTESPSYWAFTELEVQPLGMIDSWLHWAGRGNRLSCFLIKNFICNGIEVYFLALWSHSEGINERNTHVAQNQHPHHSRSWYFFLYIRFLSFGKLVILGQTILFAEVGGCCLAHCRMFSSISGLPTRSSEDPPSCDSQKCWPNCLRTTAPSWHSFLTYLYNLTHAPLGPSLQ